MSWHTEQRASQSELGVDYSFLPTFVSPSTNRPAVQTVMNFPHVNAKHHTWKRMPNTVPQLFSVTWYFLPLKQVSIKLSLLHNRLTIWFPRRFQLRPRGFRFSKKCTRKSLLLYHLRPQRGWFICFVSRKVWCNMPFIKCSLPALPLFLQILLPHSFHIMLGEAAAYHAQCPMLAM